MRRSTFGIPRIVACAELLSRHIALPRGCREAMERFLEELGVGVDMRDERYSGRPVETGFLGELTPEQQSAADALLAHETGVLSAATGFGKTVTRRDGHHPIVFMQCGPVRFRTGAKAQARQRPFEHRAILHATEFELPAGIDAERPPIQHVYAALAADEDRNDMIFDGVLEALEAGRSPILLTERKDHAHRLAERLARFARNVLVLRGGMGARQRRAVMQRLEDIPETEERVLIATGRHVGEGFDDARLDTLFLAMPISWKGTLAQYVGRLHRLHAAKREVVVHDYVDGAVPALMRMSEKRVRGYESLGYSVERSAAASSPEFADNDLL